MAFPQTHPEQSTSRPAGRLESHPARGPFGVAPVARADRMLAKGLGWFSLGLGLAELVAPDLAARLLGVNPRPTLFRLMGAREVVAGAAILAGRQPVGGLWGRVAGDVLDLSLLGCAATERGTDPVRLGISSALIAGVTALDTYAATRLSRTVPGLRTIRVVQVVPVERPAAVCYAAWRDLSNLGHFLRHVDSVTVLDERRSRWVVKGPAGSRVSWDAELVRDLPGRLLAWRSLPGASVDTAGMVQFHPRPTGGALVRVSLVYSPPAGRLGELVARLFGEAPQQQLADDLKLFKRLVETGEIVGPELPTSEVRGPTPSAGHGQDLP